MTLADGGGTMVCICHGRAWIRSQALAQIGFSLGGIWRFLALTLFFIPLPIRECGYRTLARNRQGLSRFIDRWLGPVQCRIITIQRK
jgi:predicted DCC family thiol-disulfide oxidoreductase YuxK